jgi:hypothetical protein
MSRRRYVAVLEPHIDDCMAHVEPEVFEEVADLSCNRVASQIEQAVLAELYLQA